MLTPNQVHELALAEAELTAIIDETPKVPRHGRLRSIRARVRELLSSAKEAEAEHNAKVPAARIAADGGAA